MKSNQHYEKLIQRVLDLSETKVWDAAVQEWIIFDCEEDTEAQTTCVCGKENLRYLFTIRNQINGNTLFPIGSTCIKKFERDDLNFELSAYQDMFRLLHAVKNEEFIELNSVYFSRNLLLYLYKNDVFKPNQYNGFDGKIDYNFMLKMFNKRDKDSISPLQSKKIKAIIVNDIIPFVRTKISIDT